MSLLEFGIPWVMGAIGAVSARRAKRKVLLVLTSCSRIGAGDEPTGLWLSELSHPYFALVDSGFGADFASIAGGRPPIDPRSDDEQDPDNRRFRAEPALSHALDNTPTLEQVDLDAYEAILFVGGHGTMGDFPDSPVVQGAARAFYESQRVVAAVCHGPAALVNVTLSNGRPLVGGRTLTAFTNAEEREVGMTHAVPFLLEDALRERGATFVAQAPWSKHIEVAGNLITGQNPQSAKSVGLAIAKWIKGHM